MKPKTTSIQRLIIGILATFVISFTLISCTDPNEPFYEYIYQNNSQSDILLKRFSMGGELQFTIYSNQNYVDNDEKIISSDSILIKNLFTSESIIFKRDSINIKNPLRIENYQSVDSNKKNIFSQIFIFDEEYFN